MRLPIIVLSALLVITVSGCLGQINEKTTPVEKKAEVKVFFYFSPNCPNCAKIEPYMYFIKSKVKQVDFDFCDISNSSTCTNESLWVARHIGLIGVPTAVFMYKNNVTVLVGWRDVGKLGSYFARAGIGVPDISYGNESYNVQECIECHNEKGISPPSTYNCTYCCHTP